MSIKTAAVGVTLACAALFPVLSQAGGVVVGVGVAVRPPAPIVEVVPAAPVAGYVWTPGYWSWTGASYVWVAGRYLAPPHVGAVWVPGHYVARGGGFVWTAGYWRR